MTAPAFAESGARLVYTAPEGCPAQAEFVAAVATRGARFDDQSSAKRTLHVALRRDAAGYVGSFRVEEGATASGARELHGDTCAEAADALAVVAAIALREAPSPPTENVAAVAPRETPPPASAPATPAPARGRLRSVGQFAAESVAVSAGKLTFDRDLTLTFSAGATLGVVPSLVLPRFDLTLGRANFVTVPDQQSYLITTVVRTRLTVVGPGTYRKDGFATDALALKAAIGVCSSFHYDRQGFVALLCSEFGAGGMTLETRDESGNITQTKTVGLGSAGIEADLRYNLGERFHVGFVLGGEAWLGEATAEKPDGSQLFEAGLFKGYAQLGLGLNF